MSDFDYDKIKDMTYDTSRGCYVGEDGSEFHVTPYSNGTGYKYDYYDKSPYGNAEHNSTHVKSDLNENWSRTDKIDGEKTTSSGSGCYLTSACMKHMQDKFDDNCYELAVLRWFRDKYVTKEDIIHYYEVAPKIIEKIETLENKDKIYEWIYEDVIKPSVNAIHEHDYEKAYSRYKNSVIALEETFVDERGSNNIGMSKVRTI